MNNYVLVALIVALPIVAAQPACGASFEEVTTVRSGTFTGARIRILLGGRHQEQTVRAGLAIAPTWRTQTATGVNITRFGEGLELGFGPERPLAVSIGGRSFSSLLPGGRKSGDDHRLGASSEGKLAIGLGVLALVAGAVVLGVVISHSDDAPDES